MKESLVVSKNSWLTKSKSYLKEIQVEQVRSRFSKGLAVSMIKGRYQLYTDKVIYSYEDLYKNFKITADKINWKIFKPESVLVLGLGLGSVIQIIEKKNKQNLYFTAVDIDEMALYLTHKYTAPKFRSSIEYITADAHAFILQSRRKFDLILFDIFIDDLVPPQFETMSFLRKLNQRLSPGGLLLMNRLSLSPDQILSNMEFMENNFRKVWPESTFVEVSPNWILVSDIDKLIEKRTAVVRKS